MEADGAPAARASRRSGADYGFKWISSSPTPAEVARLESRFPEVVRVPVALLAEESQGWQGRAVLVRSFSRWVPVDAFIREFRRAGISGVIEPVSLAFRCHIFKFDDPEACDTVLSRPWVINGQVIGAAAWHPEFFPAADSLPSVMVWIRLPNLPLEFWQEDILQAISEPAGEFCFADPATTARSRGGFARVAVRLDLRHPLRPGTRVQGAQGPFWQQFTYESMEGICFQCGSVHLSASCSVPATAEGAFEDNSPVFGPWMSAVRQRWTAEVSLSKVTPAAAGSCPAPHPVSEAPSHGAGWKTPVQQRRRSTTSSSLAAQVSGAATVSKVIPIHQMLVDMKGARKGKQQIVHGEGESAAEGLVTVPVQQRAVFQAAGKAKVFKRNVGSDFSHKSHSITSSNPFASLSSELNVGGPLDTGILVSGPLKRARPEVSLPPKSKSNPDARTGKGKGNKSNSRVDITPGLVCLIQPTCCPELGQVMGKDILDRSDELICEMSSGDSVGQASDVIEGASDALKVSPLQIPEEGTHLVGCHTDSFMLEDQEGVPTSPT